MTENENKSVLTELLRKVEDNPEKAPATNETDMASVCAEGDEVVELGENFDLGEFQVVRREFLHTNANLPFLSTIASSP